MYIEKIDNEFTHIINIGKYALFIYTKKDGVFINPDELFEQCQHFNHIVFCGDDPLLQKDVIGRLCKKLVKAKPDIKIEIFTGGLHKPLEINSYKDNVTFNVFLSLSNSGLEWSKRINETSIQFYIETNSNIIFDIQSKDDVEEVLTLIGALGIKKAQVYLMSSNNIDIIKYAKFYQYNIIMNVEW